ncbi:MAG: phosphonate ABC transporter ATP-binding protein [Desulfosoma sp.]|uniref:phosphonate ABC transporter ATP-binding protein n=1 Tax=Desulfosoma sp. TaxID=2603217 RepID=UPI00404A823A
MLSPAAVVNCPQVQPLLQVRQLMKKYPSGTLAVAGVSLDLTPQDFLVVIGCSGAGKSTLLRCLNRLLKPTSGKIILLGEDITNVSGNRLQQVRRRMGMIFQQFHLVQRLSVLENVLAGRLRFQTSPLLHSMSLAKIFSTKEKDYALQCLSEVGIADLAMQRADCLSGGQQQRVAIARVLAQDPDVILADEPIASLDPRSASLVMELLQEIHERKGIPVVVNLHHLEYVKRYAKKVLGMRQGRLIFEGPVSLLNKDTVAEIYGGYCPVKWQEAVACV